MSRATLVEAQGSFNNIMTFLTEGLASYTGLTMPPASGLQYNDCTTAPYTGGGFSEETGSSPAIVVGDVFVDSTITSPNSFQVICNGDGTKVIVAGGNNSRQSLQYTYFRKASNAFDPHGFGTIWINEVAPVWNGGLIYPTGVPIGTAVSVNLAVYPYFTSPEGDTMTFALASGLLPSGLSLNSAGLLSGTPNLAGTYNFTVIATDITGTGTTSPAIQLSVTQQNPIVVFTGASPASAMPGGSGGDSGRIRFRNEQRIDSYRQAAMVRAAIDKARQETAERLAREREERRSKRALARSAKPSAPTSLSKFMKMKDVGYAKSSPYSQALKIIKH